MTHIKKGWIQESRFAKKRMKSNGCERGKLGERQF